MYIVSKYSYLLNQPLKHNIYYIKALIFKIILENPGTNKFVVKN